MGADDDEIASIVLSRLDDPLGRMLILDVPGQALNPGLVGGLLRALENDGGIACARLLKNPDKSCLNMIR